MIERVDAVRTCNAECHSCIIQLPFVMGTDMNVQHGCSDTTSGVLEIRAGEGGQDAQSLVEVLGSAVLRWAARSGL